MTEKNISETLNEISNLELGIAPEAEGGVSVYGVRFTEASKSLPSEGVDAPPMATERVASHVLRGMRRAMSEAGIAASDDLLPPCND